jgi:hypothetical protein
MVVVDIETNTNNTQSQQHGNDHITTGQAIMN